MKFKDKTHYWVKLNNEWTIALYDETEDFWFIIGNENMLFTKDFEQIGEEIPNNYILGIIN